MPMIIPPPPQPTETVRHVLADALVHLTIAMATCERMRRRGGAK